VEVLFTEAAKLPWRRDKRTVKAVTNGESSFVATAKAVAELLGAENLVSVLHPELLAEIGPPTGWGSPLEFFTSVHEWDVVQAVEDVAKTSNGLEFDVWKVRHKHVPDRFGRAKCYDLSRLSTKDRTRLLGHLTRHSQVSDRVRGHPHIAQNWTAVAWEYGAFWWVIDEWIDGEKLSTLLADNRLPPNSVPRLMRQIASALDALHAAQVVRRELSPRLVVVRASDQSAVLTDFELAKLLDGAPTVSPKGRWPDDEYRAVEVEAGSAVDARADVYSWGRILVHAVCGELPPRGAEEQALARAKLPRAVCQLATACVAQPASDRPETMAKVLSAVKTWT
jgi:serine/threonine protein kinase